MNDTIVSYFSNLVGVTPSFLIVIIGFSLAAFIVVNVMALIGGTWNICRKKDFC